MKWCLLFFLLPWVAWSLELAPEISGGGEPVSMPDYWAENPRFKNDKASLIPWERVKPIEWLDIRNWKKDRAYRDANPDWELRVREVSRREMVGRMVACSGECRIYRGLGYAKGQNMSSVEEGDEIITRSDSYAWVLLFDGTMVRLSPDSSFTVHEFNIGERENFFHARVNTGNVLFVARERHLFESTDLKETDAIFLPLPFYEANTPVPRKKVDEGDLYAILEDKKLVDLTYDRLNDLVARNNLWAMGKPTHSLIVTPNGSIYGEGINAEFVVLLGGKSYLKLRLPTAFRNVSDRVPEVEFMFRGYENTASEKLANDQWYEVSEDGRSISPYLDQKRFSIGEFVTSNMPTIFVARELMLQRYGRFAFEGYGKTKLARTYGYRLWGSIHPDKKEDLYQRLSFLKEYTRRIETTNLRVAEKFRNNLVSRGELPVSAEYGYHFYEKAMDAYHVYKGPEGPINTNRETLNSTLNPFWNKIHGVK